jgi:acyl-CoA dehydrogenase
MLQNILLERKIYASEEHKMMKAMIQEFIANEVLDQIDEWEKKGYGKPRNMETGRRIGIVGMDMPETYGGAGLTLRSMHCSSKNLQKRG